MRKILRFLKRIWFLNFLRRIYRASSYYNYKYGQILRWGFTSREDTNFTYFLKESNIKYLVHTIALATGLDYQEILKYIQELESNQDLKDTILRAVKNSPYKTNADQEVRFGRRVGWYAFVRVMKPKVVIETGVDKGLGGILLCAALLKNQEEGYEGRYYGTDINPAAGFMISGKYKEMGEILYGDSIESLQKFSKPIDLFINDSDHSADYEYQEYQAIQGLIHDQSIILGDNAHVSDKLALFSEENNRHFLYFSEEPKDHWYPGGGLGISFPRKN